MQQKYQKEIEELLARIGEIEPKRRRTWSGRGIFRGLTVPGRGLFHRVRAVASPADLVLTSLVLFLAVFLTRAFVPLVATLLTWLATPMFLAGYIFYWTRWGRLYERRWRGRLVDPGKQGPDLLDWFRPRKG